MMIRRQRYCAALLALALFPAYADVRQVENEEAGEPKWQEAEVTMPAFLKTEDLQEFYVSAGTANRFYVDGKSISVGKDGVVRFTLVVRSGGGATNTTFEGIRCETLETRLYATGGDRGWTPARGGVWKRIENKPINRHHAALSRDYFCPGLMPIRTPEEGRDALRRGGHPDAK